MVEPNFQFEPNTDYTANTFEGLYDAVDSVIQDNLTHSAHDFLSTKATISSGKLLAGDTYEGLREEVIDLLYEGEYQQACKKIAEELEIKIKKVMVPNLREVYNSRMIQVIGMLTNNAWSKKIEEEFTQEHDEEYIEENFEELKTTYHLTEEQAKEALKLRYDQGEPAAQEYIFDIVKDYSGVVLLNKAPERSNDVNLPEYNHPTDMERYDFFVDSVDETIEEKDNSLWNEFLPQSQIKPGETYRTDEEGKLILPESTETDSNMLGLIVDNTIIPYFPGTVIKREQPEQQPPSEQDIEALLKGFADKPLPLSSMPSEKGFKFP